MLSFPDAVSVSEIVPALAAALLSLWLSKPLLMIAHPCPCEEEEIVFVPKSFSEASAFSFRGHSCEDGADKESLRLVLV